METIQAGCVVGRNNSIFMVVDLGVDRFKVTMYGLADLRTGQFLNLAISHESLYDILKKAKLEVLAPSVPNYFNPGAY